MSRLPALSLSARLFLIVLGGVLLATLLSNVIHSSERSRWIAENRETAAVDHLTDAIRLLAALPAASRDPAIGSLASLDWRSSRDGFVPAGAGIPAPLFAERLSLGLDNMAVVEGAWVEWTDACGESPRCPMTYSTDLRFADGQKLTLAYTTRRHTRPERPIWQIRTRDLFELGVMAVVAWIVIRLALRPLERMTRAVEDFGRDIAHPALAVAGPVELQRAIRAFNTMQDRIRGFMAERTQILAAVTHDLKTPMTRMRLRLENCADAGLRRKLCGDLAAMQSLVDEGLELARSLDSVEPLQALDLQALLQSLCDDLAESGLPVTWREPAACSGLLVMARPNALRRVLENIIDNAIKYGHTAMVSAGRQGDRAWVQVCDRGPGIPEDQFAEVLKPFVRLEASRSRETGGTGLGLAIAVNLLRAQQGEIHLANRPEGGLAVSVMLPCLAATASARPAA